MLRTLKQIALKNEFQHFMTNTGFWTKKLNTTPIQQKSKQNVLSDWGIEHRCVTSGPQSQLIV